MEQRDKERGGGPLSPVSGNYAPGEGPKDKDKENKASGSTQTSVAPPATWGGKPTFANVRASFLLTSCLFATVLLPLSLL